MPPGIGYGPLFSAANRPQGHMMFSDPPIPGGGLVQRPGGVTVPQISGPVGMGGRNFGQLARLGAPQGGGGFLGMSPFELAQIGTAGFGSLLSGYMQQRNTDRQWDWMEEERNREDERRKNMTRAWNASLGG